MSISDVLHGKGHHVVKVRTNDTVQAAVRRLADERIGAVVVEDQWMRHAGIFSERDFVNAIAEGLREHRAEFQPAESGSHDYDLGKRSIVHGLTSFRCSRKSEGAEMAVQAGGLEVSELVLMIIRFR